MLSSILFLLELLVSILQIDVTGAPLRSVDISEPGLASIGGNCGGDGAFLRCKDSQSLEDLRLVCSGSVKLSIGRCSKKFALTSLLSGCVSCESITDSFEANLDVSSSGSGLSVEASVDASSQTADRTRNFHVSGSIDGSLDSSGLVVGVDGSAVITSSEVDDSSAGIASTSATTEEDKAPLEHSLIKTTTNAPKVDKSIPTPLTSTDGDRKKGKKIRKPTLPLHLHVHIDRRRGDENNEDDGADDPPQPPPGGPGEPGISGHSFISII